MRGFPIRHTLVVATATILFLAVAESVLRAPGPPDRIIEPQTRMELVAIEPGSFVMGSTDAEPGRAEDETPHRVTLTRRIFMGRYEVTQAEWAMVMGTNPSRHANCGRCPVEHVDFYEVDEFITRLNAQSTQIRYRLPTEAEWEYACRAGTTTPFSTGAALSAGQANVDIGLRDASPAGDDALGRTMPVGSYPPNAFGLYDMHGSVWEWTNDWYGPYPTDDQTDPPGPGAGTLRVIRGGGWRSDASGARCALRSTHAPQHKSDSLGFRIVGEPIQRRSHAPR